MPEHVLAAHGFFVFCIHDPERQNKSAREYKGPLASEVAFADTVNTGLDLVLSKNPISSTRLGMSGFSFGAQTTYYLISHGDRFAAAATSNGGSFSSIDYYFSGPRDFIIRKATRDAWGLPDESEAGLSIRRQYSASLRADHIKTPLLMQLPESEYHGELQLFQGMRDAGGQVDLVIYPDEGHFMRLPSHKALRYERNVDWFTFWLKDKSAVSDMQREEFARWSALKRAF